MAVSMSRQSSTAEVIAFLKQANLDNVIDEFQANQVDGEDFFDLELRDIYQMVPRLKLRKRFLSAWSAVTKETFDVNGLRCPMAPVECSTPLGPSTLGNVLEKTMVNPAEKETMIDDPIEKGSLTFNISSISTDYCLSSPIQDSSLSDCENNSSLSHRSGTLSAKQSRLASRKRSLDATSSQQKEKTVMSSSPSDSPKRLKNVTAVSNQPSNIWLKNFTIPSRWEPDVERGLSKGSLSNLEKCALVRQLCCHILAQTTHPGSHERNHVALLLVQKYPFLKGSFGTGHQFWAKKIEDRILNLRRRDARNERKRLQEDGIVLPKGKPGRKKKERKEDTLPAIPDGETTETMESQRKKLLGIQNNGVYDLKQVAMLMDNTFSLRRRDVLVNNTRVWKLLQDYPVLKDNKGIQIKSELGRILGREAGLMSDVRTAWDSKKPSILAVLEKSKNKDVQRIIGLLEDCNPGQEKEMENRCIFAALPHQLGEKATYKHSPGQLFWEIVPDDSGVEISNIVKRSTSPKLLSTGSLDDIHSLALVAEGMVAIKFKQFSILNAVVCLLAAFYVFNAEYPKAGGGQTKNVFLLLDQLLLQTEGKPNMPIGVENFLSLL